VGAESVARAARGGSYAETEELTARAREQRESGGSGRGRGEGGRADGRVRQSRERRGGRKVRAGWARWAERPRGRGMWASFLFSFILAFVFPFLFIYSI
jgi:hypothetical protein